MPVPPNPVTACLPHKPCSGVCTGYGTCSTCPPLIVLAVIAASQPTHPVVLSTGGSR